MTTNHDSNFDDTVPSEPPFVPDESVALARDEATYEPELVFTLVGENALALGRSLDGRRLTTFVREYITHRRLEIAFDGTILPVGALLRAETPEMADAYLDVEHLSENELLDEIVLFCHRNAAKVSKGMLGAALRKELKRMRKNRYKFVIRRLLEPVVSAVEKAASEAEWIRLRELFDDDMPAELACDAIKQFIWQVKSKSLGRPIVHHLMPVIYSAQQGSGKTTFVRALVSPLRELASADILLSDFADARSGDIYRFSVAVADDLEQLPKEAVPALKSLITSERINRRRLHTSQSVSTRQRATLIGTANRPVHELIDDDTGHRRFIMMPFKNGNETKGGDSVVWKTVTSLAYDLLWRSVDPYEASPIMRSLGALHEYQKRDRPIPKLLEWLYNLDLESEKIKSITVRDGVRADKLRDLYVMETSDVISKQKFADAMLLHMSDKRTPFSEKHKKEIGAVYRMRR